MYSISIMESKPINDTGMGIVVLQAKFLIVEVLTKALI